MPHKRAKKSIREREKADRQSDLPPSQALYSNEEMPKSMARILNAEATQNAWKERKKRAYEEEIVGGGARKRRKMQGDSGHEALSFKSKMEIKPGESLRHFRRRVEDYMRPMIRAAMKNTASASKQKSKESQSVVNESKKPENDGKASLLAGTETAGRVSCRSKGKSKMGREPSPDFAHVSSSDPKRLNDIVMEPPQFKSMPRLARLAAVAQSSSTTSGQHKRATYADDVGDADDDALIVARRRMMELERDKAIARYRSLKEVKLKYARKPADDG